jgi:uncharacterized YigZ family protein
MSDYLSTLAAPSEGEFRDRGSRFLAFAQPVATREAAEAHLQALRKKYFDARHHCLAWRMGPAGESVFASDDGEPAHSAGAPILAAIRSRRLTNVQVVVVRYFGGVKLGVRGLIEAYRSAADQALASAQTFEIIPFRLLTLRYPYEQTAQVSRLLSRIRARTRHAEYTERCLLTLEVEEPDFPGLCDLLEQARIEWQAESP